MLDFNNYPTPPTSPACNICCTSRQKWSKGRPPPTETTGKTIVDSDSNIKCSIQPAFATASKQARCGPLSPGGRLGRLLEGKLQLTEILGTGAYGVVYLAVDTESGIRYAVKCLSKFSATGKSLGRRQIARQQREVRLHYLASAHPNVVSIVKVLDEFDGIYVVLEYCPEGDLFLNISQFGKYIGNDGLCKKVFVQLLDAVGHCHKLGIYHRDLKPENVLVTNHGQTMKLADFGLATSDDRSEDYGCGSTFYMSPECLEPSTRKSCYYMCAPNDVWSLGVILVNLIFGCNPWRLASSQDQTYRAYARSRDTLKKILPLTDELNDILIEIFNPNPDLRITLPELRDRIMACTKFTAPAMATVALPTQPSSLSCITGYVSNEDATVEGCGYESLSPVSISSNDGSLTSRAATID